MKKEKLTIQQIDAINRYERNKRGFRNRREERYYDRTSTSNDRKSTSNNRKSTNGRRNQYVPLADGKTRFIQHH